MPAQQFDLADPDSGVVLESRTLNAPGATTGDVLTVNADDSISPAPGGGSMPGPVLTARVATTEEISLSGLQTIDGYDVQEGESVLVWQQSDGTNGVYAASAGDWTLVPGNDSCRLVVTEEAGQTAATTLFVLSPPPEGANAWSPIGSYDWTNGTPPAQVQAALQIVAATAGLDTVFMGGMGHTVSLLASAEPADGDVQTPALVLWYDSTDGAASMNFKARTDDGTLVTASIPLAP